MRSWASKRGYKTNYPQFMLLLLSGHDHDGYLAKVNGGNNPRFISDPKYLAADNADAFQAPRNKEPGLHLLRLELHLDTRSVRCSAFGGRPRW